MERVKDYQLPKPEPTPKQSSNGKPKGFHVEIKSFKESIQQGFPDVQWFVPDLIPEGLTLLAGDAKVGKTFFALNVGLSIAQGGLALGAKDIDKPHTVCYMALDDNERRIVNRVDKLAPEGIPRNFYYINHFPYLFTQSFMEKLAPFLEETATEFLIVDTWQKVNPSGMIKGTDSYQAEYAALSIVKEFFEGLGISLMVITHTNKNQEYSNVFQRVQGSTGMQGGCDSMLLLDKNYKGITLHTTGNDVSDNEYAMDFHKETFLWTMEGQATEVRRSPAQDELYVLLRDAGAEGIMQKDLAEAVGKTYKVVGDTLKRMAREGLVIKPKPKGKWYHNADDSEQITL